MNESFSSSEMLAHPTRHDARKVALHSYGKSIDRRQAALSFLSNIRLSPNNSQTPQLANENENNEIAKEEMIMKSIALKSLKNKFAISGNSRPFSIYKTTHEDSDLSSFSPTTASNATAVNLRRLYIYNNSIFSSCTILKYNLRQKKSFTSSKASKANLLVPFDDHLLFQTDKERAMSYGHLLQLGKSLKAAYNPTYLDDPELRAGKHKSSMALPSHLASVIQYARDSDLKRDLNTRFREQNPDLHEDITLSKLRRLKQNILEIALGLGLEVSTAAKAYVFLEKLVLKNVVRKANRKAVAGACLLLAAKTNEEKGSHQYRSLIKAIESKLDVERQELLDHEFPVFVALELSLCLSEQEIMPHFNRILAALEYSNVQEYLGEKMYSLLFYPLAEALHEEGERLDGALSTVPATATDDYHMSSYSYAYSLEEGFDENISMSYVPSVAQSLSDLESLAMPHSSTHYSERPSRHLPSESPE